MNDASPRPSPRSRWIDAPLLRQGLHNLLLYAGIALVFIGTRQVAIVYVLSGAGTVVTRTRVCEQPRNNRCAYVHTYAPGASFTDADAPFVHEDDLRPGRRIEKAAGSFRYSVDGRTKTRDMSGDLAILACGLGCIALWPLRATRAGFRRLQARMHGPLP